MSMTCPLPTTVTNSEKWPPGKPPLSQVIRQAEADGLDKHQTAKRLEEAGYSASTIRDLNS